MLIPPLVRGGGIAGRKRLLRPGHAELLLVDDLHLEAAGDQEQLDRPGSRRAINVMYSGR
jgi:hypothetical protein